VSRAKDAIQSLLAALWVGWLRHAYPMLRDPRVAELEAEVKVTRNCVMHERAAAIRAERERNHYAAESVRLSDLAVDAREKALAESDRADQAEETLTEVRSALHAITPGGQTTVDDAIELIDNHMIEMEAK